MNEYINSQREDGYVYIAVCLPDEVSGVAQCV